MTQREAGGARAEAGGARGEGGGRALAPTACSSEATKIAKSLPSPPTLTSPSAGLRSSGRGHCCRHDGRSASPSGLSAAQSPRRSSSLSRRSRCCLIASTIARISRASRPSGKSIMRSSSRYTCSRVCVQSGLQPGACNRVQRGPHSATSDMCITCSSARRMRMHMHVPAYRSGRRRGRSTSRGPRR